MKGVGELNGEYYPNLLRLADAMQKAERWLITSLIYRKLLDSILARRISKYYGHDVKHLRKLDKLAPNVSFWAGHPAHGQYIEGIERAHARKSAFWGRYRLPS